MQEAYQLYEYKNNKVIGLFETADDLANFLGKTRNAVYLSVSNCKKNKQSYLVSNKDKTRYVVKKTLVDEDVFDKRKWIEKQSNKKEYRKGASEVCKKILDYFDKLLDGDTELAYGELENYIKELGVVV